MKTFPANEAMMEEDAKRIIGGFHVTKLVRQHVNIMSGDNGAVTIGQIVDDYIGDAITSGEEVQSFTMHFEPEQWVAFCDNARQSGNVGAPKRPGFKRQG